jgi:hypothetical protein
MSVVAALGTGSARSPELFSCDLWRLSDLLVRDAKEVDCWRLGGGGSVAAASKKMEKVDGGRFCNGLEKDGEVAFERRWRRLGCAAGSSYLVESAVSRNENV